MLVLKVRQDHRDLQEHREIRDHREIQGSQDPKVPRV